MNITFDPQTFECVTTTKQLSAWKKRLERSDTFAIDTETTGLDARNVDLVGVALAVLEGERIEACYIPTGHTKGKQLSNAVVLEILAPFCTDKSKAKVLSNAQYDVFVFGQVRYDVKLENIHDTVAMSYALDGDTYFLHGMDAAAKRHLGYEPIAFKDVVNPRFHRHFGDVELPIATAYSAEDTAVTLMLWHVLKQKLENENLWELYDTIDRPLIPVLYEMKRAGIKVDGALCGKLEMVWTKECDRLVKLAQQQAGEKFALGSGTQLAHLLYTKFELTVPKYTESGRESTDKDALGELAGEHPLVDTILAWRKLNTLVTTFCRGLPKKINETTHRVHTSLAATRTSTGRLASSGPNLQNIPTRTKEGKQLREAFVADKGMTLITCDYSQIEYRVLAHVSQDPYLLKAFNDGVDLHALMAADVKGGHWTDYTNKADKARSALRSSFKNVNFATIYGAGARKVAKMSGVEYEEALLLLAAHREMAPGVYSWKDECVELAREQLYSLTMFGRRVYTLRIHSKDKDERGHAERLAVNGAVQGAAADLIRKAMVKVAERLDWRRDRARLLLQVHDELVAECKTSSRAHVAEHVKFAMETAASEIQWRIPIIADVGMGQTWGEAK